MSDNSVQDKIHNIVESNNVVLFMKGEPDMPRCGFSARVLGILNYIKVDCKTVNVLDDDQIREGIKVYSDWMTIPQLYIKQEFIGGCEIVTEMTMSGELEQVLLKKGVDFDGEALRKIKEAT